MILQGDALNRMRSMPSDSVDCVITDPPYIGFGFEKSVARYWDAFTPYYREMLRLCKGEQRLAFTQPRYRHEYIRNLLPPTQLLVIEDAFTDKRGIPAQFLMINPSSEEPQSVENWPEDIVPKSIHPNDRNINKMAVAVKAMSKKGDTVLDPFCGSGAIGVACALLGRKYIGIELMEERAEDARKRLQAAEHCYLEICRDVEGRESNPNENRQQPANSGN